MCTILRIVRCDENATSYAPVKLLVGVAKINPFSDTNQPKSWTVMHFKRGSNSALFRHLSKQFLNNFTPAIGFFNIQSVRNVFRCVKVFETWCFQMLTMSLSGNIFTVCPSLGIFNFCENSRLLMMELMKGSHKYLPQWSFRHVDTNPLPILKTLH